MDTRIANGTSEMDELHRVGAGALLEDGFDSVEEIEGPDGMEVKVLDTFVGVYPGGALLKVFVDAPALEFAEEAVRELVEELLDRTELLADWTVERCQVELQPDLAKESLDAADGPDAPPDDVESRRARLMGLAGGAASAQETGTTIDSDAIRSKIRSMAPRLAAFGSGMFGGPGPGPEGPPESDDSGTTTEGDAELAAGALIWGMDVLLDELFQDAYALDRDGTNVAECDRPMWLLDELPPRYALQYDARFARRFLVTAIALTTRLTEGSFQQLSCVAEELTLRLLLREAAATLDTFGLLDEGVSSALGCFADLVYEDMDHEWLYDEAMDGMDESDTDTAIGITPMGPMGIATWFTPFDKDRYIHPYAADEPDGSEGSEGPEGEGTD
ncbi:hypothetical protein M4V62_24380 [Streptomyces durmitorensis]|uniref:Uncharacterized protein n=1 Tax=Streptomyces durmitorensis TaxID=319947 RepID=A0ABY4PXM7_9ACTN|nr:hypothetical protein [Streptomyces durmitorensis]UQT57974.1 hypothetical protein M4V62_24380 [Streptomyces durmitorensis]